MYLNVCIYAFLYANSTLEKVREFLRRKSQNLWISKPRVSHSTFGPLLIFGLSTCSLAGHVSIKFVVQELGYRITRWQSLKRAVSARFNRCGSLTQWICSWIDCKNIFDTIPLARLRPVTWLFEWILFNFIWRVLRDHMRVNRFVVTVSTALSCPSLPYLSYLRSINCSKIISQLWVVVASVLI